MISPELRWLLSLNQRPEQLDGRRLARLAISHGLTLRVLPFLDALPDAAGPLREEARRIASDDLRHRANLAVILRRFREAEIPVVPFKGPVLADRLYSRGTARVYHDLDLLTPPGHMKAAVAVLRSLEYHAVVDVADPPSNPVLKFGGEMLLRSKETRSPVDLHWKLFGWCVPSTARLCNFWNHVGPDVWQGQPILRLSDTDLAAYLCYHGSKHLWLNLKHLYDLARLFELGLSVNWEALLAEATERKHLRFLLLGPWLAHRLFGTAIPASLLEQCRRDKGLDRVAGYVIEALESPEDWATHLKNRRVWAMLLERRSAVVRHVSFEALAPSAADWQALRLPDTLSFLYYLYRPLRLAGASLGELWPGIRRASTA